MMIMKGVSSRYLRALCLMCAFCLVFTLDAEEIQLSASVNSYIATDDRPIEGLVTVVHPEEVTIDPSVFSVDGKALPVVFVEDGSQSVFSSQDGHIKEIRVLSSVYKFQIEAQGPGGHVLPPITLTLGGKNHFSQAVSYKIHEAAISPHFGLEAIVDGSTQLYPGQRTELVYRIYYDVSVDPTYQQLPLLDAQGFRRIGEVISQNSKQDAFDVHELRQSVEAVKPGEFVFGPSRIDGIVAAADEESALPTGFSSYLRAQTASVTLHVKDFPQAGKPKSFKGAVGSFSFHVKPVTPTEISFGDKIELEVAIRGIGDINSIAISDIIEDPGFGRLFKVNEGAVISESTPTKKVFRVKVVPLLAALKEIPSLEFTSFNPKTEEYEVHKSSPFSLKVSSAEGSKEMIVDEKEALHHGGAGKLHHEEVSIGDLKHEKLGWRVLWLVPAGGMLLAFQAVLRRFNRRKP